MRYSKGLISKRLKGVNTMTRKFDYENLNRHFTRVARILEDEFEENAMFVDWDYSISANNVLHVSADVSTLDGNYQICAASSLARVRDWDDEDTVIDDTLYRIQRDIEQRENG